MSITADSIISQYGTQLANIIGPSASTPNGIIGLINTLRIASAHLSETDDDDAQDASGSFELAANTLFRYVKGGGRPTASGWSHAESMIRQGVTCAATFAARRSA